MAPQSGSAPTGHGAATQLPHDRHSRKLDDRADASHAPHSRDEREDQPPERDERGRKRDELDSADAHRGSDSARACARGAAKSRDVRFLTVEEVAERYRLTRSQIYEKSRLNQLPLVVHPGARRVLFPEAWLDEFDEGRTDLDVRVTKNEHGRGRVVRPK